MKSSRNIHSVNARWDHGCVLAEDESVIAVSLEEKKRDPISKSVVGGEQTVGKEFYTRRSKFK